MVGSVALIHGGSGAEDWSTQGAAHFLEHLAFNGTSRRTQEQIEQEIDLLGAYNNATTRASHVVYLLVGPKDGFWKALDVQQDMIFHSTLPAEKVEKERGIILEELRQSKDDQTYEVERILNLDLFGPQGYGMPTVGTENSIKTLHRDQILKFYQRFYVPARTTWLIIGDVEAQAAVDSLALRVGSIPSGDSEAPPRPTFDLSAPIERVHRLPGGGTVLSWSWICMDPTAWEFTSFKARFEVLSDGDASPLGKAVLDRWRGSVEAYAAALSEYPGFSVASVRLDLASEDEARAILEGFPGVLEEIQRLPADPARVEAWRVSAETEEQYLREKPHYYGIVRGDLIAARGLAGLAGLLPAIQGVTAARVAAFPSPLPWPPARISVILPLEAEDQEGGSAGPVRSYGEWDLANGVRVAALSSPESPVFAAHLFIRDRSRREPAQRAGMAELLQNLLGKATAGKSAEDLSLSLARIGAELKTADDPNIPFDDFYTVPQYGFVRLQTLDRFALTGMGLLEEMVGEPSFSEADFLKAKGAALRRAAKSEGSSKAVAGRALEVWTHPRGAGADLYGTTSSLTPIGAADLRGFAASYLDPRSFLLVLASGLPLDSLRVLTASTVGRIRMPSAPSPVVPLGPPRGEEERDDPRGALFPDALHTGELMSGIRSRMRDPAANARAARLLPETWKVRFGVGLDSLAVLVDSAGSPQSYVHLSRVFSAPESLRPVLTLVNGILSDRLAQQLREKEGLAYSIGSSLTEEAAGSWVWTASAGTSPGKCPRLIEGFRSAPGDLLRQPPDSIEVAKTAARIYGRGLMRRATRINWAYYAGSSILRGEDPRLIEARQRGLYRIVPAQVLAAARSYWSRGPGLVIVAR